MLPHRIIWLSGVVSGGITTLMAFGIYAGWSRGYSIDSFVLVFMLPSVLGYLSTVILGIWADVRFADTQYALAIPLCFWFVVLCTSLGFLEAIGILICYFPFVIGIAMLGSRLGMYANRIRWDRKANGGRLPAVYWE